MKCVLQWSLLCALTQPLIVSFEIVCGSVTMQEGPEQGQIWQEHHTFVMTYADFKMIKKGI